jgi:hypothetical protein
VVAVGAVAHVIRRAFHSFYESPHPVKQAAEDMGSRANDLVPRDGAVEDGPSTVSVEEKQDEPQDERVQDGNEAALKSSRKWRKVRWWHSLRLARTRSSEGWRTSTNGHGPCSSSWRFGSNKQLKRTLESQRS